MHAHARNLWGAAAIVGSAMLVTRTGEVPKRTPFQMQVETARQAMADAGIDRPQVGALFTARAPSAYNVLQFNMRVVNELKVAPVFTTEVTAHGAGALGMLQLATLAVTSGVIDYALCTSGNASAPWLDAFSTNAAGEADPQFEAPYGPSTPSLYAQVARRYMHETGATSEQFARAAVENRKWALHHPLATMRARGPVTVEDVLSSRMIASPLHLLDCAPFYPGGIATAMVVTRAELAESVRPDPIYILGFGQCTTHDWITDRLGLWGIEPAPDGPNLTRTGARLAARQAYDMAGLAPSDIDLAQTSAPFSFFLIMMLEEFGFCAEGDGGRFVESGGIDYDGGFPFNTSGGYLSFGQSSQGLYLAVECIEQMRGVAQGRQVPNARIALVHGHGGPMACHSVVILGKERPHKGGG